tara:strand:+ start:45751 stop:46311 length:561 start_codon:yes stop_codon:yes gene_type:complete
MKYFLNFLLAFLILSILLAPILIISLMIKLTSKGDIFYYSERVGKDKQLFKMPKFRTMKIDTPEVATHLLKNPEIHLTSLGPFLRKYSLDEIPQLLSVLKGDMNIVGPRPALFNQYDLIDIRESCGVNNIKPGITGWAQINGRDDLSIKDKANLDLEYYKKASLSFDIYIIFLTLKKVIFPKNITH